MVLKNMCQLSSADDLDRSTSSSALPDKWENFIAYTSPNNGLGAIEHQLYPTPFVNLDIGQENSGTGPGAPML